MTEQMLVFWNKYSISCARKPAHNRTNYERAKVKVVVKIKRRREQTRRHNPALPSAPAVRSTDETLTISTCEAHIQRTTHLLRQTSTFRSKGIFSSTSSFRPLSAYHWTGDTDKMMGSHGALCLKTWIFISFFHSAPQASFSTPSKQICSSDYLLMSLLPLGFSKAQLTPQLHSQFGPNSSHPSLGATPPPNH